MTCRRLALPALAIGFAATMIGCGDDAGTASEPTDAPTSAATSEPPVTEPTNEMDSEPDDTASTPPTEPVAPTSPPSTGEPTSTPDALAEAAVADLASRLDIDPSGITVVLVEDVTWPDSSIGCPERGFQYLQVLTPGVRVTLSVDGTQYRYHAGGTRDLFYCATPQSAVEDG